MTDEKGRTTASIYTISYLADSAATAERPVAFVFNGGPGAASVFLHLGARAQGPFAPLAELPTAPAARRNCPGDIVVWLNLPTGIYHFRGERWYGRTRSGAYVCRGRRIGACMRATRNGQ